MAGVRFDRAGKRFGDVVAVSDLTLDVTDGELMVLVGPSGSGKTTALRLLAGLEALSGGHIWIGDRNVDRVAPRDRDVAMVFQDYALYPQMTVRQNLAFGLRTRKVPRPEIQRRVAGAAEMLGLGDMLDRKPGQLSGGQRQRVALGRALVREPQVFLMDEPLSNLDAGLRAQMRGEIRRLQQEVGTTTVYVTHDQVEAMTMGDRIAVLRDGVLQQVGDPMTLYEAPANAFLGAFVGSPPMSLARWACDLRDGVLRLRRHEAELTIPEAPGLPAEIVLGVRPEHARLWAPDAGLLGPLEGRVRYIEAQGRETFVAVELGASVYVLEAPGGLRARIGERVQVGFQRGELHVFDAGDERALGKV